MQLSIDIDDVFANELTKEFSTSNIKDAIYKLLDFYKKHHINHTDTKSQIEIIEKDDDDYQYILDARNRRQDGEKLYSLDSVINEFQ